MDIINTHSLIDLFNDGKFDISFLDKILSEKNLLNSIRYDNIPSYGYAEFDRTIDMIKKFAKEIRYFENFNINNQCTVNLFYIFPEEMKEYTNILVDNIDKLNSNDLRYILKVKQNCKNILDRLLENNILLSDEIKLELILESFCHGFFNSEYNEINVLNIIIKQIKDNDIKEFFEKRLENINKYKNYNYRIKNTLKCALMISGQFRMPLDNINSLINSISKLDKMVISEIFISTWSKPQLYNLTNNVKMRRYLNDEVNKDIDANTISVDKIKDVLLELNKEIIKFNINEVLEKNKFPIRIKLHDETDEQFEKMDNPEKMYYHNAYWINELGFKYFTDNFDMILKVRPDIEISEFDIIIKNNVILSESTYGYQPWGFGIGDMILAGETNDMLKILNTYNDKNINNIVKKIYSKSGSLGHVNIALTAYKNNLNVIRFPKLSHSIALPKLLDRSFF